MFMPYRLVALATAASLVASPVAALDLPTPGSAHIATGVADADGWGRHRRHRGGIDAGDVVAGVLVLGAIAAIAGSGSSNRERRRERVETYPEPMREPPRASYEQSRGIDSAVGMCVDQIERGDTRVDSVDNASRTADGWRVSGELDGGTGWQCWIDNDGRVRSIDFAGEGFSQAPAGGQWGDDAYANARAAQRAGGAAEPQPAYPGGPLPGEEGYEAALLATPSA